MPATIEDPAILDDIGAAMMEKRVGGSTSCQTTSFRNSRWLSRSSKGSTFLRLLVAQQEKQFLALSEKSPISRPLGFNAIHKV
jgi:hypothetical protein